MHDSTQDVVLASLLMWHRRGLALVPLWWITDDGVCACPRGVGCDRSAGKHPIERRWTERHKPSWPDVMAWHEQYPRANWGVRTGAVSGVWVLDFDPDNAGTEAQDVISFIRQAVTTFTVLTGGGGVHLYFRMPVGFEPTNRTGRLPRGLDVRGTGGQVVVPPSVSAKGVYSVLTDALPSNAPDLLLDLIRPVAQDPQTRVFPTVSTDNRGYAETAINEILAQVAQLAEGERNTTGWHRARRIRELCAGAGQNPEVFAELFVEALVAAGLSGDEAMTVWESSGRRDVVPAGPEAPGVVPGGPLPSVVAPPFPGGSGSSLTGSHDESTLFSDPVDALLAELLDVRGLHSIPPPTWLVDGFLVRDSLARMNGRPGSMKSFAALGMALSVAAGRPWQGREVKQGRVWYLLAEGAPGMDWRARAWLQAQGLDESAVDGVRFLPRPVQAKGGEWEILVEACRRTSPDLIILDTQSRITVGIKENDATEMGLFVERAEELRRATGACVLLVHHAGKAGGTDGRGSEVVFGALTTEMGVERHGERVTVTVTKQKNAPEQVITLRAREVTLYDVTAGVAVATEQTSLVLEIDERAPEAVAVADAHGLPADIPAAVAGLLGLFVGAGPFARGDGGTKSEAKSLFMERGGTKATFYRSWGTLVELRALGRVHGTAAYRHVPAERREGLAPDSSGDWIISGG